MATNFQGGISSYGVPVLPYVPSPAGASMGNVWYVCSVGGSDGNVGTSPARALATLSKAITLSNATGYKSGQPGTSTDDVIYILPGHVETVPSAAYIAVSKSVNIVGLGTGRNRPTFTWATLTSATITIAGSNVTWSNCVFIGTGIDAVVTMFGVTGDDVTFYNCEFDHANATNQASLGITVTGTDRFRMYGCRVHGTLNAGTTNFVQIVGSASKQNDYEFIGNNFIGAYTSSLGPINNITTACVNILIRDNTLVNSTASATKVIVLLTGSTGVIMKNTVGIGSGTAPFTMDAGWWSGNWSAAAVATAGTLV